MKISKNKMKDSINRKFCVAPMMGYTTPYARKLYRILSKRTFLFTEMIATKSLLYSKNKDLIIENDDHNPVALQVGGSDFDDLRKCSEIAAKYNYNEINLNVGCPSKAVQKGAFGACLMKNKILVRQCMESLQSDKISSSMKCRIGIGKDLNYDYFEEFIDEVLKSGVKIIYIHARNAILEGLSPKANRNIPPLNYDFVKRIKLRYPNIEFIINGGIDSIEKAKKLSEDFDGVMLGRLIQNNPFVLKDVDYFFYNEKKNNKIDKDVIFNYFEYIKPKSDVDSMFRLMSPILNIFFGVPNSKEFKIKVNEYMKDKKVKLIENLFLKFIDKKNMNLN